MSEWQKVKLGDFLHRQRNPIRLDAEQEYALVTIRVKHKGVQLREMKKGGQIGSTMYQIKKGQFILSGIDARQGAFGIVPDELDGAIITNDFWAFEVDENIVKRDFFYWLTTTPLFLDSCIKSSRGETQRIRLQKNAFYNFEFSFPPIEKQSEFLKRLQVIDSNTSALAKENTKQQSYLTQLRQAILQEAIEGKLTADWRVKNPVQKGNPDYDARALLATIQAEKQKLMADGKIKKEKPLAPINPDDVLFALPDGWVWCRTFDACESIVDCPHSTPIYLENGMDCIDTTCFDESGILLKTRKVDENTFHDRNRRLIPKHGDIVYSREGIIGQAVIVPKSGSYCLGQRVMLFRPHTIISPVLFRLLVNSPYFRKKMIENHKGIGAKHINMSDLRSGLIPLPPLAEQNAIVERVDRLLESVNALEQQVAERKSYAEQLMQVVLKEAFTR